MNKLLILLITALFVLVSSVSLAVVRQVSITYSHPTDALEDIVSFGISYSKLDGTYPAESQHVINKENCEVLGVVGSNTTLKVSVPIDLDYETDYWFVMSASTDSDTSVHSPSYALAVPEAEVIVKPMLCRERIPLEWSMVNAEGIGGYKVHYKLKEGDNVWVVIDVGNVDHYVLGSDTSLPSLEIGKEYGVCVTAYDTTGNHSDYSETQLCLIGKPPIPYLTVLEEIPEGWL